MALANPVRRLTEAEYLRIKRTADIKSSFYGGEMFLMSGGTRWESLIAANLIGELRERLKGGSWLDSRLNLPSLKVSIPFAEIFANVKFPSASVRRAPPKS